MTDSISDPEERREDAVVPGRIRVVINGKERTVPEALTIRELIEHLDLEPPLVVVERNREIVERDRYSDIRVEPGDELELVHFVGGG